MDFCRKNEREYTTSDNNQSRDADLFTGAAMINCRFKIYTLYALGSILKQALEHVRFNRVGRLPISELDSTDESILQVRVVAFNIKCNIAERQGGSERLYKVPV